MSNSHAPTPETRSKIGTFVKTSSVSVIELLAQAKFDFAVLDAEHAPLDRGDIDLMLLAGRAGNLPLFVRPPIGAPDIIQSALDSGARGILAPHVDTIEQAKAICKLCRFENGTRGFSRSTRSADFGARPMSEVILQSDMSLVICQIETPLGVESAIEIAALDGVAGLMAGRADLAVAMGEKSASAPAVLEQALKVVRIARSAGKIAGLAAGSAADALSFEADGANWFVVNSDQGLLKSAAANTVSSFIEADRR